MTKAQLEAELRIYKEMYRKASEERMHYYFILNNIVNGFTHAAIARLKDHIEDDYLINTDIDVTAIQLIKRIKGE